MRVHDDDVESHRRELLNLVIGHVIIKKRHVCGQLAVQPGRLDADFTGPGGFGVELRGLRRIYKRRETARLESQTSASIHEHGIPNVIGQRQLGGGVKEPFVDMDRRRRTEGGRACSIEVPNRVIQPQAEGDIQFFPDRPRHLAKERVGVGDFRVIDRVAPRQAERRHEEIIGPMQVGLSGCEEKSRAPIPFPLGSNGRDAQFLTPLRFGPIHNARVPRKRREVGIEHERVEIKIAPRGDGSDGQVGQGAAHAQRLAVDVFIELAVEIALCPVRVAAQRDQANPVAESVGSGGEIHVPLVARRPVQVRPAIQPVALVRARIEKVVADEAVARGVLTDQVEAQLPLYQGTEHACLILLCVKRRNAGPCLGLETIAGPACHNVDHAGFGIPAKAAALRPAINLHMVNGQQVGRVAENIAGRRIVHVQYDRGIAQELRVAEPAVVLYVDDAPSGNVLTYTTDLLAIDHVEVYRGPQGSRFGRNSEAGVINIVTRRPGDRFEAEARASIATFNTQQYQAGVLGPLVKGKLRFDLVGQYASSDGFIRNNFLNTRADQRDGLDGRAYLHWTPSDQWNVDFTATADRFRDGIGLVSLSGDPHRTQSDFDGKFDEDGNSQSLRVRGSLSDLAITSVTTRRDFNLHPFMFDPDFSPLAGNTGIVNWAEAQWSQELRVSPVAPEGKWDWRAGFFFATAETDLHRPYYFFVPPLGLSGSDTVDYTEISDSYALFGE